MLVKAKTSKGETIQIYDSEYLKDLDLKDFGLTDIEDITELDGLLPIYPLNDIILSQIIRKSTDSQKLENLGLYTWGDLSIEYSKINEKISHLSHSQRELVKQRFTDVSNVLVDPKNGPDPNEPVEQPDSTGDGESNTELSK